MAERQRRFLALASSAWAILAVEQTHAQVVEVVQPPQVKPEQEDKEGPPEGGTPGSEHAEEQVDSRGLSDLPYYVPADAERLPQQEQPVAPPQPAPPEVRFALAPLLRHHARIGSGPNVSYLELGGVIRFGSQAGGFSVTGMTDGSFAVAYEMPTLLGVPIYEQEVTIAFVPRGYIQLEVYPNGGGAMATNAGLLPSVQISGCQGIPWYLNVGAHGTAHLWIGLADGTPQIFPTVGLAIEAGILLF